MSVTARKLDTTRCLRCPASVPEGDDLCASCLERRRASDRERARRMRARRAAAGQCRFCGVPGPARCDICKIKHGRVPRAGRVPSTGNHAGSPAWGLDAYGWRRYRGIGRRGPRTLVASVEQAIAKATGQLARALDAWRWAAGPGGEALPPIQRIAARSAAAAEVDLALRIGAEAAARIRGVDPEAEVDEADDALIYPRMSAAQIAAVASVGTLIYTPPPEQIRKDSDDDDVQRARARRQLKGADLAPLWHALAARGLAIVEEGAFWWRCIATTGSHAGSPA